MFYHHDHQIAINLDCEALPEFKLLIVDDNALFKVFVSSTFPPKVPVVATVNAAEIEVLFKKFIGMCYI